MSTPASAGLLARLGTYQAERFPLAAYVPMVLAAAAAAVAWSRAARGAVDPYPVARFAVAAVTMLLAFLLLRIADEHKDAALDRVARPELPVPRGVVTLAELRAVAAAGVLIIAGLNLATSPALAWPLGALGAWIALMTAEFFVPAWLRARPVAYLLSHMVVMPLVLFYGTATDWLTAGAAPPDAMPVFLSAAYMNGLVLEIGRKLREPAAERPRVETYTATWGTARATAVWCVVLVLAALAVGLAMQAAGASVRLAVLTCAPLVAITAVPARGVVRGTAGSGKRVEVASGLWNLAAYVLLALPWVLQRAGRA